MARDHLRGLAHGGSQLRHNGANDRAFKIFRHHIIKRKNGFQLHRVLIARAGTVCRKAGNE